VSKLLPVHMETAHTDVAKQLGTKNLKFQMMATLSPPKNWL